MIVNAALSIWGLCSEIYSEKNIHIYVYVLYYNAKFWTKAKLNEQCEVGRGGVGIERKWWLNEGFFEVETIMA